MNGRSELTQKADPSTPNADKVNCIMEDLQRDVLSRFELPPNVVCRNLYDSLQLPWTVEPPVTAFDETQFVRIEWDRDGVLSNGKDFVGGTHDISLDALQAGYSTGSTVTRWRAAHPDLASTEEDCVVQTIQRIRQTIGPGEEKIRGGLSMGLLLFKRV